MFIAGGLEDHHGVLSRVDLMHKLEDTRYKVRVLFVHTLHSVLEIRVKEGDGCEHALLLEVFRRVLRDEVLDEWDGAYCVNKVADQIKPHM